MVPARKILYVTLTAVLALAMAAPGVSLAADPPADVDSQSVVFWKDAYESDNTTATARFVPEVSSHTIHELGDIDMVKIDAEEEGDLFTLETEYVAASNGYNDYDYGDFDTQILVYDSDGITPLVYSDDHPWFDTYTSSLVFEAPHAGIFYVAVSELDDDDRGAYTLYVNRGIGHRISGADRYATSAAVAHRIFDNANIWGNENGDGAYVYDAVVASGEDSADAITGSVLAAAYDAPLFLTQKDSFSSVVQNELYRLFAGPSMYNYGEETTVYVVGGSGAISDSTVHEIALTETVSNLEVIEGDDRYGTAAAVAYEVDSDEGVQSAYIVNGDAWPDAISVSAVAPYNDGVILLTTRDSVPQVTLDVIDDLGIDECYIVGGTNVVSDAVTDQLMDAMGEGTVDRFAGVDRYQTSRLVAEYAVDDLGNSTDCTILASGEAFPDALCAGPLSWWLSTPVLLTPSDELSGDVVLFLEEYGPIPSLYHPYWGVIEDNLPGWRGDVSYLVGGPSAVTDEVYREWRETYFRADD